MDLVVKGVILGFIMVLPGMSAGTVLLVFGLYEKMVNDILKLNIKPYIPLAVGIAIGIIAGGFAVTTFFENYRDATFALLLGCLLASIRAVLKGCPKINSQRGAALIIGGMIGLIMVQEPLAFDAYVEQANWSILIIGGAISTAAMIIPGIPGSSVLIILDIYDVMLSSIAEFNYINLLLFGLGSIIGIALLLNILSKVFERYRVVASYFFAGLILASSRSVLPSAINPTIVTLFILGFVSVWIWSGRQQKVEDRC